MEGGKRRGDRQMEGGGRMQTGEGRKKRGIQRRNEGREGDGWREERGGTEKGG